ncbi:hypothetical protein A8H39_01245 [Paraburkholderia fungorum]|uniref:hypothetical protein n=1 Tax=Paraburkholderia fungorum TaxID=134537 RepID=UPI000488D7C8|nr:hypothetical protein [Paraburkholderia fungorum]PNE59801.1 hypothetical protein A8H39_01245 [Paraburkholderia fungorum]
MVKKLLAIGISTLLTGAAHASNVEFQRGVSLHEQVRQVVQREGYTLVWRLPVDATAVEAARPYLNWVDAIYGATKQLSETTVAGTKVSADLAAPVVCDGSRTITITTLRDARRIVNSEARCHDLK